MSTDLSVVSLAFHVSCAVMGASVGSILAWAFIAKMFGAFDDSVEPTRWSRIAEYVLGFLVAIVLISILGTVTLGIEYGDRRAKQRADELWDREMRLIERERESKGWFK